MKEHARIFDTIAKVTDLQEEIVPGQPLVELCGCSRVLVENHRGVCEYTPCRVAVRVKYGAAVICGENLELIQITRNQLIIHGHIHGVELVQGG